VVGYFASMILDASIPFKPGISTSINIQRNPKQSSQHLLKATPTA
jgi:hypothetical protein